jgi:Uma2 family endonuclease
MQETAADYRISVDEYLQREAESEVRHEYVGGYVYAMAGGTARHNRITGNIYVELLNATEDVGCTPLINDVIFRVSDDVYYYPDIMVVCDPERQSGRVITGPCLVVEVLSPSTRKEDRREKLALYRNVPSVRAYLIVHQADRRVERHWRDADGVWQQTDIIGEGVVPLPCPEMDLSLDRIYRRLPAEDNDE